MGYNHYRNLEICQQNEDMRLAFIIRRKNFCLRVSHFKKFEKKWLLIL